MQDSIQKAYIFPGLYVGLGLGLQQRLDDLQMTLSSSQDESLIVILKTSKALWHLDPLTMDGWY